jgi:hypothetical protein
MNEEKKDNIDLFKHADEKIERTRSEVSNLLQEVLKLTMKTDRLTDRIDNGVAITGQKTLEKVSNLASDIAAYTTKFASNIDNHETRLKTVEDKMGEFMRGIFWLAFTGVGGGLIALVWLLLKR